MKSNYRSVLASTIASYLSLKEALGRLYGVERRVLAHLDAAMSAAGTDLTSQTFQRWVRTRSGLTTGVRRNWMRIVRNYCLYRRRTEPECFVPDSSQFPACHQAIKPYIFQEAEIVQLLAQTARIAAGNGSPLRRENALLGLVLLYTAGLRRGELLRLTVGDCDLSEGTLLVRESKFHKSRLLPLSTDALYAIKAILHKRQRHRLPLHRDAPLLLSRHGAYSGTGFSQIIGDLLRRSGISTPAGRPPRVHDFRHTFAVHALLRWYRLGEDVQAKLPALATYMGHVSVVSTEHYLQLVEELTAFASDRFERRYGALVAGTDGGRKGGGRS
jgi:integrase